MALGCDRSVVVFALLSLCFLPADVDNAVIILFCLCKKTITAIAEPSINQTD